MVRKVVIVGGGSAGFMAAMAVKTKIPQLQVVVIRSKEIGIIGVGEGSGVPFTVFLHKFLGLPIDRFVQATRPGLKLGTCFHWGPRPRFLFPFGKTLMVKPEGCSKAGGYYCFDDMEAVSLTSALMGEGRVFEQGPDGRVMVHPYAYHIENDVFAEFLESLAAKLGVQILTDTIRHIEQNDAGITALHLSSGRTESGDLYVDCSGFGSLLLGKALGEPFVSYASTLFCDRAVVGGWSRTTEPIHPYTTAETMESGWCWQIEHLNRINRGYVYSSAFITDDQAEREFRAKNPKITGPTRIVKFVSGRYERSWVKNVVAIGNSSAFVEPLEATALSIISTRAMQLTELLGGCDLELQPVCADMFNRITARVWDSTRRFLATHYRYNSRLDTPFWRHCSQHTDLAGAEELVEWYRQVGPSPYAAHGLVDPVDVWGIDGYLTTLVGQSVPYHSTFRPSSQELARWNAIREQNRQRARRALTVPQALSLVGMNLPDTNAAASVNEAVMAMN